jgi:hypothetical protein
MTRRDTDLEQKDILISKIFTEHLKLSNNKMNTTEKLKIGHLSRGYSDDQ